MTEDATLSDFAADGREDAERDDPAEKRDADGSSGTETGPEERDATDDNGSDAGEAVPPGDVDPAVSTYAWGEYACERCGERTERAWRADGDLVCPACKPW